MSASGGDRRRSPPFLIREHWPPDLLGLCEKHGFERVWKLGLEMFGFPPTLGIGGMQLVKLVSHLENTLIEGN